jgi:hypothetical protein
VHEVAKLVIIEQISQVINQNVVAKLSTVNIPQAALVIFSELQVDT